MKSKSCPCLRTLSNRRERSTHPPLPAWLSTVQARPQYVAQHFWVAPAVLVLPFLPRRLLPRRRRSDGECRIEVSGGAFRAACFSWLPGAGRCRCGCRSRSKSKSQVLSLFAIALCRRMRNTKTPPFECGRSQLATSNESRPSLTTCFPCLLLDFRAPLPATNRPPSTRHRQAQAQAQHQAQTRKHRRNFLTIEHHQAVTLS